MEMLRKKGSGSEVGRACVRDGREWGVGGRGKREWRG